MIVAAAHADRATVVAGVGGAALLIFCVIAVATFSAQREEGGMLLLAYAGGMSMLLTPCRLPVVLAIVPLCRRGSAARGVVLALLFGAGLTVTQTFWGVAIAAVGELFGFREAARYLSLAGGALAYLFGLSMLGLLPLPPLRSGSAWSPSAWSHRSEFVGAAVMGLLLGNTGLCCPDPVFLSIVPFIAAKGDLASGAMLAAAYGLGRATPLVAVVMLARGSGDALQLAVRHKRRFDRALAWGLVAVGTLSICGYSAISNVDVLALTLLTLPVVGYHVKSQSGLQRTAAWLLTTAVGALAGTRALYWLLLNVP